MKILDACPFFVSNIDLKVELQAEMTFAVAAPNELHLKFHLDAWASDIGQIIGCAVVSSLCWPIAGPIVLNELKSNSVVGDYFAGLLLGLPMICSQIASAIAPLGVKEVSAESFGPHCVKATNSDVDCTYPLSFNAGAVFPISMRDASVHGTVAGLVLTGHLSCGWHNQKNKIDRFQVKLAGGVEACRLPECRPFGPMVFWSVIECNRSFLTKSHSLDLAILVLTGHDAVISKMLKTYTSGTIAFDGSIGPRV